MSRLEELEAKVQERLDEQERRTNSVAGSAVTIATFPGFKAALRIEEEDGRVVAAMVIAGNAAIVAETIKWTADAFKEDQER